MVLLEVLLCAAVLKKYSNKLKEYLLFKELYGGKKKETLLSGLCYFHTASYVYADNFFGQL